MDHWLAGLNCLPAYAGHAVEPALRVLKPETRAQFQALLNVDGNRNTYHARLNPLYVTAVRKGKNLPRIP